MDADKELEAQLAKESENPEESAAALWLFLAAMFIAGIVMAIKIAAH